MLQHDGTDQMCEKCRPPLGANTWQLSRIDARILAAIAAGLSSVRIGLEIHLSRQAVDYHIAQMLRSVQAVNRPQLVSKAYAVGLLTPRRWPPEVPAERIRDY